jgi:predicted DNA-binding transcriptional regulator AlpA
MQQEFAPHDSSQEPLEPLLLTIPQVAKSLGISRAMVYALLVRNEGPPAIRIGRVIRWMQNERMAVGRSPQGFPRLLALFPRTNHSTIPVRPVYITAARPAVLTYGPQFKNTSELKLFSVSAKRGDL